MSILSENALLNNVKNCKIGREGHPLVESGLTNLDEKCIGKHMFHTAVFLQDAPEWSIYDREWMTWDLKDSLVIESHKCCYLQHCQKKRVPHPAYYSHIQETFKLPRRTADICKVLLITKVKNMPFNVHNM